MEFSTRLTLALKRIGKIQTNLQNDLDIDSGLVSSWKSRGGMGKKYLKVVSEYLDVDTNFLLGLQDEFRKDEDKDFTMIKSYNIVAGMGAEGFLPDVLQATKLPVSNSIIGSANPEFLHIIQVKGDSMKPTISDDDWLIVDMVSNGTKSRIFEPIAGIYLIRIDDVIQLKRLEFLGRKGIDIISDNSIYGKRNTLNDGLELEVLGKLYKHIQDLGELAIKSV